MGGGTLWSVAWRMARSKQEEEVWGLENPREGQHVRDPQEHVPGGTTRSEAVVWEERSKVQKVRSGRWAGAGFRKALRPRTGLGF